MHAFTYTVILKLDTETTKVVKSLNFVPGYNSDNKALLSYIESKQLCA